jgi:DNA-binding response OmpR family regulator
MKRKKLIIPARRCRSRRTAHQPGLCSTSTTTPPTSASSISCWSSVRAFACCQRIRGQLGLELARQHRPDVIVLDVHLPDIEGIDFLRTIRQDPLLSRTPVIVVSAEDDRQLPMQMIAAGAQVYLTKPLNLFEFFAALDAVLPRVQT